MQSIKLLRACCRQVPSHLTRPLHKPSKLTDDIIICHGNHINLCTPFLITSRVWQSSQAHHKSGRKRKDEPVINSTPASSSIAEICGLINEQLERNLGRDAYVSEEERQNIIQLLLNSRVPLAIIKQVLPSQPVLLKHSNGTWTETVSFLKTHGFQPEHLLPLISGSPSLLRGATRKTLLDVLALLRSLGIFEGKRQAIVVGNPHLLSNDDLRPIQRRHAEMLSVFTKAELQRIMISSPCVLTDCWNETRQKIEYVYRSMGIRSLEMSTSRMFNHTYLHLVSRHRFAERAGAYRMPNKHEIAAREENRPLPVEIQNPTLKELVDSSDAAFVRLIGDLTVEEYHSFVSMMAIELEETMESELSDDSDVELYDEELQ